MRKPLEPDSILRILKCSLLYFSSDADESKADNFSDGELKDKKCTICSQIFTTESQLQKHLREHEINDKVSTARQVSAVIATTRP